MDENGSWSGLIGALKRGEADLSISDISVTPPRSKVTIIIIKFSTKIVQDDRYNTLYPFHGIRLASKKSSS